MKNVLSLAAGLAAAASFASHAAAQNCYDPYMQCWSFAPRGSEIERLDTGVSLRSKQLSITGDLRLRVRGGTAPNDAPYPGNGEADQQAARARVQMNFQATEKVRAKVELLFAETWAGSESYSDALGNVGDNVVAGEAESWLWDGTLKSLLAAIDEARLEHRADFLQVEFVVVVQRHHQPLALRHAGDRLRQAAAEFIALQAFQRSFRRIGAVHQRRVLVVALRIEADHMAACGVLHDLVVLGQRDAEALRNLRIAGLAAGLLLDVADRLGDLAQPAVHRARRPVSLPQFVQHRAADADAGIGLEGSAARAVVVPRRVDQADHAGLQQVIQFHVRGQPCGQMQRDALDQPGVALHQLGLALGRRQRGKLGVHAVTPNCGVPLATSRSTKNSRLPRAPGGRPQPEILRASALKAWLEGQFG